MSRTNETRYVSLHKTCACKCRLDSSVSNDRQRSNSDKCRCKCKELIDKARCSDGFIWKPNTCKCEFDKSCDVGEYLDYANFKCRQRLIDKIVLESEDEILNTISLSTRDTISIANRKVTYKISCLI